jgi:hypothetical protein
MFSNSDASTQRLKNLKKRLIASVSRIDNIRDVPSAKTQEKFSRSIRISPGRLPKGIPSRLNKKMIPPIMRNINPKMMNIREISKRDIALVNTRN